MKVGFTGTRRGMTLSQKLAVRELLLLLQPEAVQHGDCVGADADFHEIATGLGLLVQIRPCNLSNQRAFCHGIVIANEKPPLERNKDIVFDTNLLIACPGGATEELRSGTWATMRYTRKYSKPLYLVWPDGATEQENMFP